MILPEELYELVKEKLEADDAVLKYARVFMSLLEVVSGDFFNQYCKAGNIVMLSEGRAGIDHVFSLRDGMYFQLRLRLEMDLQLILYFNRQITIGARQSYL
jgi:ribonuclease P/MRP protein subunit RPP40